MSETYASEAEAAYLCTLEIETTPGVWFEIGEIKGIQQPDGQVEALDRTHMKSPGRAKEKAAGLIDYGTVTYPMNWVPGSTSDAYIRAWRKKGDTRNARITLQPENEQQVFPAHVAGYSGEANVGEIKAASLTLEVDGETV